MLPRCSLVVSSLISIGAAAQVRSADVVLDWNSTARQVMKFDGAHPVNNANPGWSSRSLAMMNTSIYDVFQAKHRTHTPYLVDTQAVPGASLEAAVHRAAYEVLLHCYPGEAPTIQSAYDAFLAFIPDDENRTNGISLGSGVAQAVILDRTGDNSDDMTPYILEPGPGKWRPDPTQPGQVAQIPNWGTVDNFIPNLPNFAATLPPIPALASPQYAAAYNEVKAFGVLVDPLHPATPRTPQQEQTGLFWSYDRAGLGPPPVLFTRSLAEIAAETGNTPAENARMFAMASVAMADAAIAAWDTKYEVDFWRPITAIRSADVDGNPGTSIDPFWKPLGAPGDLPGQSQDDFTPPFPSYSSGHATMGGAVFKSLELFYGTNEFDAIDGILGNDSTYALSSEEFGSGGFRAFSTFTQNGLLHLGTENSPQGEIGASRVYLGVDWIFSARDGITLGNNIATFMAANLFLAVPLPGDFNGDGRVDEADLDQWEEDFGQNADSDADNDDDSDGDDFLNWQRNLGAVAASPAAPSAPEPASWGLLGLGGGALITLRRKMRGGPASC